MNALEQALQGTDSELDIYLALVEARQFRADLNAMINNAETKRVVRSLDSIARHIHANYYQPVEDMP